MGEGALAPTHRLVELDVLRGFAVAVMILVVSPGAWEFTYAQLQHANWHGWTLADFVFPDFLFGVGMALGLTFGHSLDPENERRAFWLKTARRVVLLIALGLALNYLLVINHYFGTPPVREGEIPSLRLPGVLQRIALCYLLAVGVVYATASRNSDGVRVNPKAIAIVIAAILLFYWLMMTFIPVPGFGAGQLDQTGNFAAYIDRAIFTPEHMWPIGSVEWAGRVVYDPEGLLSTLPATANVLFGVIAIGIWRSAHLARVMILLGTGVTLIIAAFLLDPIFPINKKIWTSSFALLSSGVSFLALCVAIAIMRSKATRLLAAPFNILGGNAILAFSISIILTALASIPLTGGDQPKDLRRLGMETASQLISDPYLASLACAFFVLAFIFTVIWPLHRKGVHLRL
jgi:predicted acyltransferase